MIPESTAKWSIWSISVFLLNVIRWIHVHDWAALIQNILFELCWLSECCIDLDKCHICSLPSVSPIGLAFHSLTPSSCSRHIKCQRLLCFCICKCSEIQHYLNSANCVPTGMHSSLRAEAENFCMATEEVSKFKTQLELQFGLVQLKRQLAYETLAKQKTWTCLHISAWI